MRNGFWAPSPGDPSRPLPHPLSREKLSASWEIWWPWPLGWAPRGPRGLPVTLPCQVVWWQMEALDHCSRWAVSPRQGTQQRRGEGRGCLPGRSPCPAQRSDHFMLNPMPSRLPVAKGTSWAGAGHLTYVCRTAGGRGRGCLLLIQFPSESRNRRTVRKSHDSRWQASQKRRCPLAVDMHTQ